MGYEFWKSNLERRGRWVRAMLAVLLLPCAAYLWFGSGESFFSIGFATIGAIAGIEACLGWSILAALGVRTEP